MIVSWDWLGEYVDLSGLTVDEVMTRLSMTGLNCEHAETVRHADGSTDVALDVEVTSNRPDALSIVGVAREVGVLFGRPVTLPDPRPPESGPDVAGVAGLAVEAADLCPRYTLRVVRGVSVGESPDWLVRRLTTLRAAFRKDRPAGAAADPWSINNVVDVTNYVLFETGQPLHAFDLQKLTGPRIVVRRARAGERLTAINHVEYALTPDRLVIADAERPVALAGVMGGADSEVTAATTDVLIEAATFDRLSIRETSRLLNLPSDASYRFERGLDPEGVDRASRRACELIVKLCGGTICRGEVTAAAPRESAGPVTLRFAQVERILGVAIPGDDAADILTRLGCRVAGRDGGSVTVVPPSWRADLTREIDLIEEVARIHGYEAIPENAPVPMASSRPRRRDRVAARVRQALSARGFDETLTPSLVSAAADGMLSPSADRAALTVETPMLGGQALRRSLLPSLILAKRHNDAHGSADARLYEIAKVYLPRGGALPEEPVRVGLVGATPLLELKGVIETLLASLRRDARLAVRAIDRDFVGKDLFDADRVVELTVAGGAPGADGDAALGLLGELSEAARKRLGLRTTTSVAELSLDVLEGLAVLEPQARPVATQPAIVRDANLIVAEEVRWDTIAGLVRRHGGPILEDVAFRQIYRDPNADGPGMKRVLLTMAFRAADRTLTGEDVERAVADVVAACRAGCGARLVGTT